MAATNLSSAQDWRAKASKGQNMPRHPNLKAASANQTFANLTFMVIPDEDELIPTARMKWRMSIRAAIITSSYSDAVSCIVVLEEMPQAEACEHLRALNLNPNTPVLTGDWVWACINQNRLCELSGYRFLAGDFKNSPSTPTASAQLKNTRQVSDIIVDGDVTLHCQNNLLACQQDESSRQFLARIPPLNRYHQDRPVQVVCPTQIDDLLADDVQFQTRAKNVLLDAITELSVDTWGKAFERRQAECRDRLQISILRFAAEGRVLHGKWMVQSLYKPAVVWSRTIKRTLAGRLGCGAELRPSKRTPEHWDLFVYTRDFRDLDDIKRVLAEMARIFGVAEFPLIYYKPCAYDRLEMSSDNEYGLPTSIYNSKSLSSQAQV